MSRAREDFIARIVDELWSEDSSWFHNAELARDILRRAKTLQHLAETACNRSLTPKEERRQSSLKEKVAELCKPWNIEPVFQNDPRGAVVKLKVPSGATDDWGRTGICVPTF